MAATNPSSSQAHGVRQSAGVAATQPSWLAETNAVLAATFGKRRRNSIVASSAVVATLPAPTTAKPKFPPTEEQIAIVEAGGRLWAVGRGYLRLVAYAGAGKTSTLRRLAEEVFGGACGLYIAFNSAIAKDAQGSFPRSVEVRTLHSLARRALAVGGGESGNLNAHLVLQIIGKTSSEWLHSPAPRALSQARWIAVALTEFCQSADQELAMRHIERALDRTVYRVPVAVPDSPEARKHHSERMELRDAAAALMERLCPRVWAVLANWRRNGTTPPHDLYLKLFEMDGSLVRETMAGYGYLMLDEAQDLNPVMRSVAEKSGRPVVAVGDPFQQIYGWRGAEDALEALPGEVLPLSQSFRFGPAIADLAWDCLTSKPEKGPTVRLKGNPARQSEVCIDDGGEIAAGAVVARTNAGVLRAAAEVARSGRHVCVVGGIEALAKDLQSALALYQGRRQDVVVDSLKRFESWADLKREAEDADDVALLRLIDAIEKGDALRDLAAIEKMHVTDERRAAVVVSTVHKSKGREWSAVTMWDDFPPRAKLMIRYRLAQRLPDQRQRQEMTKAVLEEWHVEYVAITRAVDRLFVRGRQ